MTGDQKRRQQSLGPIDESAYEVLEAVQANRQQRRHERETLLSYGVRHGGLARTVRAIEWLVLVDVARRCGVERSYTDMRAVGEFWSVPWRTLYRYRSDYGLCFPDPSQSGRKAVQPLRPDRALSGRAQRRVCEDLAVKALVAGPSERHAMAVGTVAEVAGLRPRAEALG